MLQTTSTQMPKTEEKQPSPINVRLSAEVIRRLDALADASGLSRHNVAVLVLGEGLALVEGKAKADPNYLIEAQVRARAEILRKSKGKDSAGNP